MPKSNRHGDDPGGFDIWICMCGVSTYHCGETVRLDEMTREEDSNPSHPGRGAEIKALCRRWAALDPQQLDSDLRRGRYFDGEFTNQGEFEGFVESRRWPYLPCRAGSSPE